MESGPMKKSSGTDDQLLIYELRLITTQAATGYFAPVPRDEPIFDDTLSYLREHPFDEFMHRWGLQQVLQMPPQQIGNLLQQSAGRDAVLTALLLEATLTHASLAPLGNHVSSAVRAEARSMSPLVILRSASLSDQDLHRRWIALIKDNLQHHRPLPRPSDAGLPPLYGDLPPRKRMVLADTVAPAAVRPPSGSLTDFETVHARAMAGLERAGIRLEGEMRHESALSPIGLLQRWHMETHVAQDGHRFHFSGLQTAYGKGLSLERARASCAMEIVERCSSFATVVDGRLPDSSRSYRLRRARLSELQREGRPALDPNALRLEVPYEDQPLYWMEGSRAGGDGESALLVPFQAVFLFANLDEVCLFSGLGSTGLAAGATLVQAKFHALLECIERDAEAVQPFDPAHCFRLATRDPAVGGLLDDYRRRGIDAVFQDCSQEFGIPCYKCFVCDSDGETAKGTSAHFTGWQAALAALTETPYPYPHGPASRPGPEDLPVRYLEELPDYASGSTAADLQRLETLLGVHDFRPIYVDLTRRDIGIPVVRALVPGLELMADFDCFSRVSPRLYRNVGRTGNP
jgi:ribosomal protein S12 methylthiotransferase accessory factor